MQLAAVTGPAMHVEFDLLAARSCGFSASVWLDQVECWENDFMILKRKERLHMNCPG